MGVIDDFLQHDRILVDVDVRDKDQLFQIASERLAATCRISAEDILAALVRRERLGSTALGQEVAMPHASVEGLEGIRLLYMRLKRPCFFDDGAGSRVVHALFIIVPAPANQTHLDILAEAAGLFSQAEFQKALRQCDQADQVREAFRRWNERNPALSDRDAH